MNEYRKSEIEAAGAISIILLPVFVVIAVVFGIVWLFEVAWCGIRRIIK